MFGIDEHGRYYPIKNKPKNLWITGDAVALNDKNIMLAPEQWQVIEWLRVKHGIWVTSNPLGDSKDWPMWDFKVLDLKNPNSAVEYELKNLSKTYEEIIANSFNLPQEAYSAAFDYIKENNLI
jgi:hypothetical protein